MAIHSDIWAATKVIKRAIKRRRNRQILAERLAATGADYLGTRRFRAAIYFADTKVNLYQIRQWYGPMMELSKNFPVVVISRNATTTNILLDECPLPVFYGPKISEIETFLAEQQISAVFYVDQN